MAFDVVPIDTIKRVAHLAAERGESLNAACPWPFESEAGRRFKAFYFFHVAALEALAEDRQS